MLALDVVGRISLIALSRVPHEYRESIDAMVEVGIQLAGVLFLQKGALRHALAKRLFQLAHTLFGQVPPSEFKWEAFAIAEHQLTTCAAR